MSDVPILLIIYNRPSCTKEVFEAIRKIKPAKLYVAADGAKYNDLKDEKKCKDVRHIIEGVDWQCDVKKLYRTFNLGCFEAVSGAINWFFSEEEMGIILEDDCLPSADFYPFCSQMLYRYYNNEKVISINGSNLGYSLKNGDSYTFSRFMNMWGWATWGNRASKIDYNLSDWESYKNKLYRVYQWIRKNRLDIDAGWFQHWVNNFNYITNKEVNTWDWQWIYYQLKHHKLSVVPAVNMVTNIGFNNQATHTKGSAKPAAEIPTGKLGFPIKHPQILEADLFYEEEFVKRVWCEHKPKSLLHNLEAISRSIFGTIVKA